VVNRSTPYNPSDPEEAKFEERIKTLAKSGELAVGNALMAELKMNDMKVS